MNDLLLVDSHLDLAENVTLFGRDLSLGVVGIRTLEKLAKPNAELAAQIRHRTEEHNATPTA